MKTRILLALSTILFLPFLSFAQCDVVPGAQQWQTDGVVFATAKAGNKLYIGGSFSSVSIASGPVLSIPNSAFNSVPDFRFPRVVGTINAIVSDGSGGWIIGGSFTKVGLAFRTNLARVKADYTVDAWTPSLNGAVNALAVANGQLFVGGAFITVNGQSRQRFAVFNMSSWGLDGIMFHASANVNSLYVDNNRLYIGGAFTSFGGQGRQSIARINLSTNLLMPAYNSVTTSVNQILVKNNTVYIAGNLSYVFTAARNYFAAFDTSGTLVTAFNPNPNGDVKHMMILGNTLYIGGSFTSISSSGRNKLAAYDLATRALLPWNPGPNGDVYSLCSNNGAVCFAGTFTQVGGIGRSGFASVGTASTGAVDSFSIKPTDAPISLIAQMNGSMIVHGAFTGYDVMQRRHLAAFDMANPAVLAWNPNPYHPTFSNLVTSIVAYNNHIYVGGVFNTIAGQSRNHFAVFDSSGAITSFDAAITGLRVNAVCIGDNRLFIGGEFSQSGGQSTSNLAVFDLATSALAYTGVNANDIVRTLAFDNGNMYIGGQFSTIGGQSRPYAACVQATSGAVSGWTPSPDGYVLAMLPANGKVYLGGTFSQVASTTRPYLACVDSASGSLLSWNPSPNANVQTLRLYKDKLFAGGAFSTIASVSRPYIAAFDEASGSVLSWNVRPDSWVYNINTFDSTLFICGSYTQLDSQSRRSLSLYNLYELRPATPAAGVAASAIGATTLTLSWTSGSGDGRVVLAREAGSVNTIPLNNVTYTASSAFGAGSVLNADNYVVYAGTGNNVTVTNLQPYTNYHFSVFEYSAYGGCTIFNSTPASSIASTIPVTLLKFDGATSGSNAILTWSTASESGSKGFYVQRSADNALWNDRGFKPSDGNSSVVQAYRFVDEGAFEKADAWYYRLRQEDLDGRNSFSSTLRLTRGQKSSFSVFPSPAHDRIMIDGSDARGAFEVLDVSGRALLSGTLDVNRSIDISTLRTGLYMIRVTDEAGDDRLAKFVVE